MRKSNLDVLFIFFLHALKRVELAFDETKKHYLALKIYTKVKAELSREGNITSLNILHMCFHFKFCVLNDVLCLSGAGAVALLKRIPSHSNVIRLLFAELPTRHEKYDHQTQKVTNTLTFLQLMLARSLALSLSLSLSPAN